MKKKYFVFLIMLITSAGMLVEINQSYAQQNKIDSLLNLLKTYKSNCPSPCIEDTSRVNFLNMLAWELIYINPDTAIILSNEALEIAQKIQMTSGADGWQTGIGQSWHQLGALCWLKGDYSGSLEYYVKALEMWDKILSEKNPELINQSTIMSKKSGTIGNIGNIYMEQGDYPKALDYYLQALKMDESLVNKKGIARHLGNIGAVYKSQTDYTNALDYFNRSLKISEELDIKSGIARQLGNIGSIYMEQGDYKRALEYYFKALKTDEELGNKNGMAIILGKIGNVYATQEDLTKAHEFFLKGLKLAEELGDINLLINITGNLGTLYIDLKKYAEGEKYLLRALAMADSIGFLQDTKNFNVNLSILYTLTGNDKKALEHYKKAMVAKDSLFNEEKDKEITSKALNYEFDKKEAATKAEQDKKDILTAAQINRQALIKNTTLAGVGIAGIFVFLSVRSFNRRKKISFEKKVTEVEMKALRSQMNPHFISNSLQSINNYILINEKENASEYLSRFSKLMRLILENSREQEITIEKDLLALDLYLQLEKLRFKNKFDYKIEISKDIDAENTLIPPLLLQPFVENSILHGVRLKDNGHIFIKVNKQDNMIRCTVEDNGIGREQSVTVETGEQKKRESLGMKVTLERIAVINQIKKVKAAISVFDLRNTDNIAEGLRVELMLPLEHAF